MRGPQYLKTKSRVHNVDGFEEIKKNPMQNFTLIFIRPEYFSIIILPSKME